MNRRVKLNGRTGTFGGYINGRPYVRLDGDDYSRVVSAADVMADTAEPPPPRVNLARCRYCGGPAEVRFRIDRDSAGKNPLRRYLIGCFWASCPVSPRDTGVNLEAARARWNREGRAA